MVDNSAAQHIAAEIDRALDECRCLPAKRLMEQLSGVPYSVPYVASRRQRIATCRNIDVDHKCLNGQLVEVE